MARRVWVRLNPELESIIRGEVGGAAALGIKITEGEAIAAAAIRGARAERRSIERGDHGGPESDRDDALALASAVESQEDR
jgi:hypothetical protein